MDDLANLCVFLMNNYSGNETVNAGTGKELTIRELTELVAKVVGYTGEIKWDPDKPNANESQGRIPEKGAANFFKDPEKTLVIIFLRGEDYEYHFVVWRLRQASVAPFQ